MANRMSATSMASLADPSHEEFASNAGQYYRQGTASPVYQYPHERPTAIPRPSLQQSRNTEEASGRTSQAGSMVRARTYSQPFGLDSPYLGASPNLDERRPISPSVSGKGTRIPVSRGRSGSTSSPAQSSLNASASRVDTSSIQSRGYSTVSSKKDTTDLWVLDEGHHSRNSRSTAVVPRHQASDFFDEQRTYGAKSYGSHGPSDENDVRASTESEERPFEHWYRGDVSRNGGVGELRVGRRQEMLDIANYGHTFRKATSRTGLGISTRSRSNSRNRERSLTPPGNRGTRQRAESVGARRSIYLDEDEQAALASMVLDERPPTDIESDGYDEDDLYQQPEVLRHPNGTISSPTLDIIETYATNPIDVSRNRQASRTRIPTPARRVTPPDRTPSPSRTARNASEPESSSAPTAPRASLPRSQSQPQSATKRAAKSPARPAAATAAAAKKLKTKQPPSSMQPPKNREADRRSIGQYPTPEFNDLANAIPTWTQPVTTSGNWDDVRVFAADAVLRDADSLMSVPLLLFVVGCFLFGCAVRCQSGRVARCRSQKGS